MGRASLLPAPFAERVAGGRVAHRSYGRGVAGAGAYYQPETSCLAHDAN